MIEQIDKYREKLFADPVEVETFHGTNKIAPQRTNNILEQFFRCEKRRPRKKSGTSSLSKSLKTILADTPFVRNLEKPEYVEIILDGCKTLAERFSKIDSKLVCQELGKQQKKQEKIIPEMRKVISSSNLPEKILMPTVICDYRFFLLFFISRKAINYGLSFSKHIKVYT